jgi:hypothetical protein
MSKLSNFGMDRQSTPACTRATFLMTEMERWRVVVSGGGDEAGGDDEEEENSVDGEGGDRNDDHTW